MCGGGGPSKSLSSGGTRPAGSPGRHSASPRPQLRTQGTVPGPPPGLGPGRKSPGPQARGRSMVGRGPSAQHREPSHLTPSSRAGPGPSLDWRVGWPPKSTPRSPRPPRWAPRGQSQAALPRALAVPSSRGLPSDPPGLGPASPTAATMRRPTTGGEHLYCQRVTTPP